MIIITVLFIYFKIYGYIQQVIILGKVPVLQFSFSFLSSHLWKLYMQVMFQYAARRSPLKIDDLLASINSWNDGGGHDTEMVG